jgi:transcriptional regulator with XRE-family HTH domain
MNSNIAIISKVIYSKYKQGKLSKRDLANQTGLSLNTINNTLNGKNSTVSTLFKLMDCLEMNLEDVVTEAKKQGFIFPKAGKSSVSSTSAKSTTSVDDGTSVTEIANKLGTTEAEMKANLDSQTKSSSKKDIKVFQVAD